MVQTYTKYITALLIGSISGQWPGTLVDESHLPLKYQECTLAGGCKATNFPNSIVLDSNWRQIYKRS